MKTYLTIFIFLIYLPFCVQCKSSSDKKEESKDDSFVVTGVLTLDEVGEDVASGQVLQEGQTLEGATVFIKGFPDQSVETDANGAFTIEVDTAKTDLELTEEDYKVLMWFTVKGDKNATATARFGANADVEAELGNLEPIDIGEVALTFTMALHVTVTNSLAVGLEGCDVSVEGIDDQLKSIENGDGRYDLDYLPPDDYTIRVSCDGYVSKGVEFTVDLATTLDSWQVVDTIVLEQE